MKFTSTKLIILIFLVLIIALFYCNTKYRRTRETRFYFPQNKVFQEVASLDKQNLNTFTLMTNRELFWTFPTTRGQALFSIAILSDKSKEKSFNLQLRLTEKQIDGSYQDNHSNPFFFEVTPDNNIYSENIITTTNAVGEQWLYYFAVCDFHTPGKVVINILLGSQKNILTELQQKEFYKNPANFYEQNKNLMNEKDPLYFFSMQWEI